MFGKPKSIETSALYADADALVLASTTRTFTPSDAIIDLILTDLIYSSLDFIATLEIKPEFKPKLVA